MEGTTGLTLKMSHLWLLSLLPRRAWEDPRKPLARAVTQKPFPFRGAVNVGTRREGHGGQGSQLAMGRPEEAGPHGMGGSGSEAHLVCIRFIRLIANKGIRANLLI